VELYEEAFQSVTNNLSIAYIMDLNVFVIPIKVLKGFGLWQNKNVSRFYTFYGIFMHLIFLTSITLFQFLYVIEITTTAELLDFLMYCPSFVAVFIKSLLLVNKIDEIESLLASMEKLTAKVKSPERYKHRTNAITKFYKIYCTSTWIATAFAAYTSFTAHEMPFKMWLPFDPYKSSFAFLFVTTISIISALVICIVGTSLDLFPAFLMVYADILLDDLCASFATQQIDIDGKNNSKVESRKRFLQLIDEHRKIKQLITEITKVMKHNLLIKGLTTSIIVCAISCSLSTVRNTNLERIVPTNIIFISVNFGI